jgi:ESCRT-I complex subunit VPS28
MSDLHDESEELKYAANTRERNDCDDAASLFAILSTLEALETAYIRGAFEGARAEEYKRACTALIGQYKQAVHKLKVVGVLPGEEMEGVEAWAREWDGTFASAFSRVRANAPADAARDRGATRAAVVMTNAITRASEVAALRLEQRDFLRRDELTREITATLDAADNCGELLPHDWPHISSLQRWVTRLRDPITEADLKALKNDLALALGSWNVLVLK